MTCQKVVSPCNPSSMKDETGVDFREETPSEFHTNELDKANKIVNTRQIVNNSKRCGGKTESDKHYQAPSTNPQEKTKRGGREVATKGKSNIASKVMKGITGGGSDISVSLVTGVTAS